MSDDNQNKCDTCKHHIATCDGRKIVWKIDRDPSARGAKADKVVECDAYSRNNPPPVQSDQHADEDPHEKDESRAGIEPFERDAERRAVDVIL
jgi:hypothetical protein